MKKRLLSILLTLCLVLTLLPTAALAAGGATPTPSNTISVKIGDAITYYDSQEDGWNAAAGAANTNGATVQLLADWKAAPATGKDYKTSFGTGAGFGNKGYIHVPANKTITLDLNDYTIDRGLQKTDVSEGKVISVNGTLTLTDSGTTGTTGTITGAYNLGGGAVDVQPKSTFTMQGGSITGNNATSNESSPAAGGVYVGGTFTMTGGSITDNKATGTESMPAAGGVLVATGTSGSNNTLTVGGTAQITGNKLTGGTTSNVLLQNITNGSVNKTITCSPDTPLVSGATIGVTTETPPKTGTPVTITDASSANYSRFFFSDDPAYHTINTGTSGNQVVQLQLSTEQFTLPKGQTYYFDLSGEVGTVTAGVSSTMGTINTALPDPTLHYVPFTYAGTVNAYSLHSRSADADTAKTDSVTADNNTSDPKHAIGYKSDRSLFVADYNVSHTITWAGLNTASLIFGKTFDENYKLRSLSAGIWDSHSGSSLTTNEWDRILGKSGLTAPIKNWINFYSWGQDTDSSQAGARTIRGSQSVSYCNNDGVSASKDVYGWRPALEVDTAKMKNSTDLKAVTLNLNGGSFNSKTDALNIVCAGTTFKAPNGVGLTRPSGNDSEYFKWNTAADGKGTSYEAGAAVQSSVTALYAQWNLPREATPAAAFAATGADSGTLSGLIAGTSYKYSVDGGSTYTDFTGATAAIAGGITAANGVWVVKKGDNITTIDSAPLEIAVTQAPTPTVGKTDCTTSTGNDGTMTGVTAAMEYKLSTALSYTAISGTTVTGLAPATYHVRVKATGDVLAGADASVTISYNGGGGDYIPPVQTTVDSGKEVSAFDLDSLASEGKTLTVNGKNGEKLVLDAETIKALAKAGGNLVVTVGDAKGKLTPEQAAQAGDRPVYDLTAILNGKIVTNFDGKITVSLPYLLKDGENAEDVTVWYLATDGSMTEIPATYDPKTGLATFTVTHFSKYVVGVWLNPFTDVKEGAWYFDAVKYVHKNGMFSGVSATTFAPNASTTRAMLWSVLARQAGQDTAGGANWYEKARAWAVAKGVSDGTNPTGDVTREQLVTMLWRYSGSPTATGDLSKFTDADSVSAYAKQAMAWAVEKAIVSGTTATTLSPKSNAARAELASIMMRYTK